MKRNLSKSRGQGMDILWRWRWRKYLPRKTTQRMNCMLLVVSIIAIFLDPLFFYVPAIRAADKCLSLDAKLGTVAVILRSIIDAIHSVYIVFCVWNVLLRPSLHSRSRARFSDDFRTITRKYPLRFFLIDVLAILPLPQVVILGIIPRMRSSNILEAMVLLKSFLLFQYVPRVIRIYQLSGVVRGGPMLLAEAASTKAALNLLLFLLASHVLGGLWYFQATERATTCWQKACSTCTKRSFYCSYSTGNLTFIDDLCPVQMPDTRRFDFGIYLGALQSGIAEEATTFPQKFIYCLIWGLQNLSCFGQNLKTSTDFWENCFAAFIIISGLILFVSLIGNMQTYIQSKTVRMEEMRLKGQEIEHWTPFRKLPEDLKEEVKKHQRLTWQETKGVDVENFLNCLPRDLRGRIKRELSFHLIRRVPLFEVMDDHLLDAVCDRVKPVLYTGERDILRGGDPIHEMVFIMRGKVKSVVTDDHGRLGFFNCSYLKAGDFFGEELLTWAFDPACSFSNLPTSSRSVRSITDVEAFALVAEDLKFVVSQFRQFRGNRMQHVFRFYSRQWRVWAACFIQAAWRRFTRRKLGESMRQERWRVWAACFIQAAWRRFTRRKLEESMRQEVKSLQDSLENARGRSSLSLAAASYATRFAVNALSALRRTDNQRATLPDRLSPVLLMKPPEPDLIGMP